MKRIFSVLLTIALVFTLTGALQAAPNESTDSQGQLKYYVSSSEEVNDQLVVHGFLINVGASMIKNIDNANLKVFDKNNSPIADGIISGNAELSSIILNPGEVHPWDVSFDKYKKDDLPAVNVKYDFQFLVASEPSLEPGINIFVQNQQIHSGVAPFIQDGSTLVPLRAIFDALKSEVNWDASTQTVTVKSNDGDHLTLKIGEKKLAVNGKQVTFDVPAQIVDGITFVPLRAVSEALDAKVFYGSTNDIAVISIASFK